jgi:nucleotide-binding universal stress UspA family protein
MSPGQVEQRKVEMAYFPTKILLATDASKDAARAAQMATEIANNSGSELHVLHVGNTADFHVSPGAEQSFSPLTRTYGEIREQAEMRLEEAVRQVEEAGGTVARTHLRAGSPDEEILKLCDEQGDFGLIVMGSRGLGPIRRRLMGSVSESVIRHARCPVLVVRQ